MSVLGHMEPQEQKPLHSRPSPLTDIIGGIWSRCSTIPVSLLLIAAAVLSAGALFSGVWLGIPAILTGHLAWYRLGPVHKSGSKKLLMVSLSLAYLAVLSGFLHDQPKQAGNTKNRSSHQLEPLVIEPSPEVDEQLFLITVLDRYFRYWPNVDPKNRDPGLKELVETKRRVQQLESYVSAGKFDPELVHVCQGLIEAVDAQFQFLDDAGIIENATFDELKKGMRETVVGSVALGWGLGSAIDKNDGSFDGNRVLLTSAVALLGAVYNAWDSGTKITEARKSRMEAAAKQFADKLNVARLAAQNAADNLVARYSWERREAGLNDQKLDDDKLDTLAKNGDFNGMLPIYRDLVKAKPRDPFVKSTEIYLEVKTATASATAENYLKWASRYVETAALIPRPSIYDTYRCQLLTRAQDLALIAAKMQLEGKGFRAAPVEGGEWAVIYAKTQLKIDPTDTQGIGRWSLGFGLAHAGHLPESKLMLLEIQNLFPANSEFDYTLARLDSCLDDASGAFDHLKSAFKKGYTNVQGARKDADLERLHARMPKETEDLLALKYHWDVNYGLLWDDIILTNDSAFTITNVALSAEVANSHRTCRPSPNPLKINSLAPGESHKWTNCFSIDGGSKETDTKRATIESDQGKR